MRYRWTIEFDADDDTDADGQVEEALQVFHSIHTDQLVAVEIQTED